ncbi:MAG TPA: arginase family protein [Acetobacteraceae bacterium]|nr:arginase family protein [Acetobacteraceae bacterium]
MATPPSLAALYGAGETSTFLGFRACADLSKIDATVALLGVPGATPYASVGAYCRNGPAALRRAMSGLSASVDRYDFDANGPMFPAGATVPLDCGDLPFSETDFAANRSTIQAAVRTVVEQGAVPALIGGDDSVPIPFLDALSAATSNLTIVQIDAHIDWRDEVRGERMGLSSTMRRASAMAHVGTMIQIGARGTGSAAASDYQDARAHGVRFFPAEGIHRDGVREAVGAIPASSDIAICFDADGLDPSIMPAAIGRSPGGLSYWQALDLLRGAASRGRIVGMAFVEFMAERDVDGLGALNFGRLLVEALGLVSRQRASSA